MNKKHLIEARIKPKCIKPAVVRKDITYTARIAKIFNLIGPHSSNYLSDGKF